MKLPFGIHEGWPVEKLPINYLFWLASQRFIAQKHKPLLDAVMEEIEIRFEQGGARLELLREQLGTAGD